MVYGVYAIRDKLTAFMSPAIDASDASAIRNFARAVNQPDTLFDFASSDFDLYKIGEYDDQSGALKPIQPVQFIASGASLVGYKVGADFEK